VDFGASCPRDSRTCSHESLVDRKLEGYDFSVQTQDFRRHAYDGLDLGFGNTHCFLYILRASKSEFFWGPWIVEIAQDKDTERLDEPIDGHKMMAPFSAWSLILEIARKVLLLRKLKPRRRVI